MKRLVCLLCGLALAAPLPVLAHAFPEQSQPPVGAIVDTAPTKISIRFNSYLSAMFNELEVKDDEGHVVSSGEPAVDPDDPARLEVAVPRLEPGTYHVYWRVTSKDGHRTEGDYDFTVSGH